MSTSVGGRQSRGLSGLGLCLPPVLLVLFLVGLPIVVAIAYSLGQTGGLNAPESSIALHQFSAKHGLFTIGAYRSVLTDPTFLKGLVATLWVTALSTVLVLAIAWAIGLYVRFSKSLVAKALSALVVVPLFIPVVIASYALLAFWSGSGFMRSIASDVGLHSFPVLGYSLGGVVIGEVWVNIPFGVLMVVSGLQAVPDALIEAARDLGASRARAAWEVLLPLNFLPTVIVGTFTAIYVIGSFTVPYLTGPSAPTLLGVAAANTFQSYSEPQQAEVIAIVLFLLAVGVGSTYVWANVRANRATEMVR
jgi:ABC-type spermidine/putrescine transport system permease subunit I